MTQNKTLSWRKLDLQKSRSDFMFYFLRTVFETVFFLCHSLRKIYYYLTQNHNQQCLFHLKTVA